MKDRSCLTEDQLLLARDLPAEDSRHRHVMECARCRSRLHSLESFLDDTVVPEGARPDLAEPRLAAAISRATGTGGAGGTGRPRRFWMAGGVLALAAALAVFMIVPLVEEPPPGSAPSGILRGEGPAGGWELTARQNAGGRLVLSWAAVPRADGYLLTFHDAALREVGQVAAGARTDWVLDAPADGAVFWQVTARKGAEILRISPPAALQP